MRGELGDGGGGGFLNEKDVPAALVAEGELGGDVAPAGEVVGDGAEGSASFGRHGVAVPGGA